MGCYALTMNTEVGCAARQEKYMDYTMQSCVNMDTITSQRVHRRLSSRIEQKAQQPAAPCFEMLIEMLAPPACMMTAMAHLHICT